MAGHSTPTATLVHDAMFYGSDEEFVATLAPFVRAGVAQGEVVTAALTRSGVALLREAVDTDADAISFIDRDAWYERPATTIAGWHRLITAAGTQRMRIVGEVAFGARERHPAWTRYEAAINEVFAQVTAQIVCPYDVRVLPPAVLDDVRRTHPTLMNGARRQASGRYLSTEQLLRVIHEPMPPVSGPPAIALDVADGIAPARHALTALLAGHGWSGRERGDDLVLAASEITTNSLRYGQGRRELRVWVLGGTVTCEVTDDGPGLADLLTGYRPPDRDLPGGRGLWIARQLCDALAVDHRDGATRVRFAVAVA